MNNAKSMSLRARINNFSKQHGISPQLTLQSFFAERFLARIAKSPYVNNLAIKGGTLMSAILGIERRTTMDVDATVIGIHADEEKLQTILKRGVATTRPRDFYDLYMLHTKREYKTNVLSQAAKNTFANRKCEEILLNRISTINAFKTSDFQRDRWRRYTLKMPFAKNITFDDMIESLEKIFADL